jgi:copper chaperone
MEWAKYFCVTGGKIHKGRMISLETGIVTLKNMVNQQDADKILEAIEQVWGLIRAEVKLSKCQAIFTYDERMASPRDFEQAIIDLGYELLINSVRRG